jgi:sigma-B regulation protein RsbU (phosphoserine phosphatase)
MDDLKRREFRIRLLDRRQQLEIAQSQFKETTQIVRLLEEVDSALKRMDEGSYGLCEICHEPIEETRLAADPLLRNCLDHLTSIQQLTLEQDLNLAARVQQQMLPKKHNRFGGWEVYYHYEAAGPVSGDYCDLVIPEIGGDNLFFFVGDISGKGVAASMLMANLHAIFRSLVSVDLSVKELVERANRIFCESTLSSDYATLVCGKASPEGVIDICNAGHCPLLLIRQGEVICIEASGLPVGVFCSGEYATVKVQLSPGDSLILYTDGLTEAKNDAGEEYGIERLFKLVSANYTLSSQSLVECCVHDVEKYLSNLQKTDDLTVMVIQRIK